MGWAGDHIFPRKGVYELFGPHGESLGVLATWYEQISGTKYVNEWRVHLMPLTDQVQVTRTHVYGAVDADSLGDRRAQFQSVWNNYKAAHPNFDITATWPDHEPGVVDREWIGTMQNGQGFNLQGASSATAYGGPPPANRGQ